MRPDRRHRSATRSSPARAWEPGGAQSVQSCGIANEPRSAWRRLNVSTPETVRTFRTTNRCPRKGWNGWTTSADPKGRSGRVQFAWRVPTIRDRVVQMPASAGADLRGGPIASRISLRLSPRAGRQDGSPTGLLARDAAWAAGDSGRGFSATTSTSTPHSPLMRSLARRISDGRMLRIIKSWMTAPVVEVIGGQPVQTTEAKRTRRGTRRVESRRPERKR